MSYLYSSESISNFFMDLALAFSHGSETGNREEKNTRKGAR